MKHRRSTLSLTGVRFVCIMILSLVASACSSSTGASHYTTRLPDGSLNRFAECRTHNECVDIVRAVCPEGHIILETYAQAQTGYSFKDQTNAPMTWRFTCTNRRQFRAIQTRG